MARKVQMILVDDIDGGEAKRTVTFTIDGKNYEIDLNEANLDRLTEAMAPFVDKARRSGGAVLRSLGSGTCAQGDQGRVRRCPLTGSPLVNGGTPVPWVALVKLV